MTMKKRFVAGMLASAFVLSLGMTAVAEGEFDGTIDNDTADLSADITVNVETQIPTISVTLPTEVNIIINPYKLTVDGASTTIISVEQTIENTSDCAINIDITAAAVPTKPTDANVAESTVKLASAPLKDTEDDHSVFLYLDTKVGDAAYATAPTDAKTVAATQMILGKSATKEGIMKNIAATDGTAAFQIKGDACSAPETPWASTDTVDVTLGFKIVPVAAGTTTPADPNP